MRIYAFADEASPIIDNQIVAMKRNGLQGLEIRGVDGQSIAVITLDKAREVRAKMDAAGLQVWTIGSPIGKVRIDEDNLEQELDRLRHAIEVAKILGAENIRLFSFFIPKGEDPYMYKEEVLRRMKAFADVAEGSGIDLCHENEKGIYGENWERCLEILQAEPRLKGIFDPANFVQCNVDTLQAWDMLKGYIKYMHIKDALADGYVVPAGAGIGNVPQIVEAFMAQGGDAVTIEPHLTVFKGLADLEQQDNASQVGKVTYPNSDAAFDAACNAFKELI